MAHEQNRSGPGPGSAPGPAPAPELLMVRKMVTAIHGELKLLAMDSEAHVPKWVQYRLTRLDQQMSGLQMYISS